MEMIGLEGEGGKEIGGALRLGDGVPNAGCSDGGEGLKPMIGLSGCIFIEGFSQIYDNMHTRLNLHSVTGGVLIVDMDDWKRVRSSMDTPIGESRSM